MKLITRLALYVATIRERLAVASAVSQVLNVGPVKDAELDRLHACVAKHMPKGTEINIDLSERDRLQFNLTRPDAQYVITVRPDFVTGLRFSSFSISGKERNEIIRELTTALSQEI